MIILEKKTPNFHRGLGAEFVFRTDDGILFVSGGRTLRLSIAPPEDDGERHRLLLRESASDHDRYAVDRVLFQGSVTEVYARFCEIEKQCMAPPRVNVGRKGLYAALAAFTAAYLVFCHPAMQTDPAASYPAAAGPAGLEQIIERLQKAADGSAAPGGAGLAAPMIQPGSPPAAPSKEAVTDRPDFLALPEEAPARQPEVKQETQVSSQEKSPERAPDPVEAPSLPAYTPDMYQARPTAPEQKTEQGASHAPTEEEASPAPVAPPPVEPSPKAPDALPKEPQHSTEASPAAKAASVASADVKPDPGAAKAVESAMKNGMDQQDALETLRQLQAMTKMDPSAITPEMLAKLPHEIAQQLKDTGVLSGPASMPETGDAPYKAIRLPEEVIEKYRGKDGIASIPENDTYAALGNRVVLQLPGGGDIRKPEDLKGFGFNP